MNSEKRKALRSGAQQVSVQFFEELSNGRIQRPYEGIVENCSAGGMYIVTDSPSRRGNVVTLTFRPENRSKPFVPVQVRATVRWVREVTDPKGMGVEFLECAGTEERDFKNWMTNVYENEIRN